MSAPLVSTAALDARVAALDVAVSQLEAAERAVRAAEAARFEAFAAVFDVAAAGSGTGLRSIPSGSGGEILYRTVRAEAAAAIRHSEYTVERCFSRAHSLTFSYPRTLDALREGAVSERHAAVVVDAGAVIGSSDDPDAVLRRAGYEEAVLEHAQIETPSRLRPIARRIAEQYAQLPLDERHAEARKRRRVSLLDGDDGMCDLIAHVTAAEAHGMYAELTRRSREIERAQTECAQTEHAQTECAHKHAQAEPRSRDEIRADLLVDIVLGAAPAMAAESPPAGGPVAGAAALRARVQIVIPVECLASPPDRGRAGGAYPASREASYGALGAPTADPAPTLTGYGPIDTETAREIAGLADTWELVRVRSGPGAPLADPGALLADSGAPLSVDRYRPSAAMRRHLAARDQHCRFPGCRAPLARCDIDHTIDAAKGGATATDNLAHLCRGHHTLKHHTAWTVRQRSEGELEWTSPTGRSYRERSPGRVVFSAAANAPPEPAAVPF